MTMIDRVAEALKTHMFAPHELPLDARLTERYNELARVAIEAMREPTDEMTAAVYDPGDPGADGETGLSHRAATRIWHEMIDAALLS